MILTIEISRYEVSKMFLQYHRKQTAIFKHNSDNNHFFKMAFLCFEIANLLVLVIIYSCLIKNEKFICDMLKVPWLQYQKVIAL